MTASSNPQTPTVSVNDPQVRAYTDQYLEFVERSPSSYHAAHNVVEQLEQAGFSQVDPSQPWVTDPGDYYLHQGGAVLAWRVRGGEDSFRVVGAHTDSPALKLKPVPARTTTDGWGQLLVEIYGGPLYAPWLDRELRAAGMVVDQTGGQHLVATPPLALIPSLAPHLDREVNSKGLTLDPQAHLQPLWTVGDTGDILDVIARSAGLEDSSDILSWELFLSPSEKPGRFGANEEFIAAGRQDNLSSSFAGLHALLEADVDGSSIPVLALFDHEEIGSATPTGARGPLLPTTLRRIALAQGIDEDGFAAMLTRSYLISADAGHGVHPNYPEKLDPQVRPMLGAGPLLKVDADQRYVTNPEGTALWKRLCQQADVPTQPYVTHSSMRSGSTIGPALATMLGLITVDVGIPLLAMHSTREVSHVLDPYHLSEALEAYWAGLPVEG